MKILNIFRDDPKGKLKTIKVTPPPIYKPLKRAIFP